MVDGIPFGFEWAGFIAAGRDCTPLSTEIPSVSEGNFLLDDGVFEGYPQDRLNQRQGRYLGLHQPATTNGGFRAFGHKDNSASRLYRNSGVQAREQPYNLYLIFK